MQVNALRDMDRLIFTCPKCGIKYHYGTDSKELHFQCSQCETKMKVTQTGISKSEKHVPFFAYSGNDERLY